MNITILLFVITSLLSSFAYCETYTWKDENGVNFTDNYESIPTKYRKNAKVVKDSPRGYTSRSSLPNENQTKANSHYSNYEDCVEYEKINIRLNMNVPAENAYRRALLYCGKAYNADSVEEYGRGYNILDNIIDNRRY